MILGVGYETVNCHRIENEILVCHCQVLFRSLESLNKLTYELSKKIVTKTDEFFFQVVLRCQEG